MYLYQILALIGAVAIFLFGMEILCTGLHKLSSRHISSLLANGTQSVWRATILSALITALVQSSSAVTVILVGLVAAGTMTLEQSTGFIAGANIGTCATAFLVHFGLCTDWTDLLHGIPPLIVLTFLLPFVLRRSCPAWISVCTGLLALLCGMVRMQDALAPLSGSPLFAELLGKCSTPLSGLFAGTVITAILQSSSACIALLQAASASGMLSIGCVAPIILGQNIGTCVTALLASLHTNRAARQTAMLHLLFNVIGAAVILPVLFILQAVAPQFTVYTADSAWIACFHLTSNIISTLIFLPLRHRIIHFMTKNSPPLLQRAVVK